LKIEYTPITSAQFVQKITAEFIGGAGPDVMYMYDDTLASAVEAEWLRPLDDLPGIAEIYDAAYPVNRAAMSYGGQRYGVPYYTDNQALVYNAEILSKAGFRKPPRTLDELEAQAIKIKDKGLLDFPIGIAAQLQDTAATWIWALVYANEQDMFDERAKPIMSQSGSAMTGVLEWLRRASLESKVIDPAAVQTLPVPADNALMAGQYAFMFAARYGARKYNNPEKSPMAGKIKVAHIPGLESSTRGTVGITRMYCLNAQTKLLDPSVRLINYLGGFDEQGEPYTAKFWFAEQGLGFPFPELAKDGSIQRALKKWIDPQVYEELAESAVARSLTAAPWYNEFETVLQSTLQEVLIGDRSVTESTAHLDASALTLAKKYE
ncbi:MAG: extracellular solute-binding protein, partial [Propionibacteriales bacterium]|nr:extracellular solute-binding protein [Propionibacteriales bacterium]